MLAQALDMNSGPSTVWVKYRISSIFCLLRSHASDVNRMNFMGNIWFEMIEDNLLSLKRSHTFETAAHYSDVKVVLRTGQVNHLDARIG